MCEKCGCAEDGSATITDMQSGTHQHLEGGKSGKERWHRHGEGEHEHEGGHEHEHEHEQEGGHGHGQGRVLKIEQGLLTRNELIAERNRGWFGGRGILALNLMSSPGAGKTSLLERTLRDLRGEFEIQVIEGDQATMRDGERIRATGCRVMQINTGAGCHLDGAMIESAVSRLDPPAGSIVVIENVGNLVCPALFDLGERARVVVASVTEGDDKPAKYPHMFRVADLVILNKVDLLPHVDFRVADFRNVLEQVNPGAEVIQLSVRCGTGLEEWYEWLRRERAR